MNSLSAGRVAADMATVQRDGLALRLVKAQTPELCMAAVQQDGEALKYVRDDAMRLSVKAMLVQSPAQASVDADEVAPAP